MDGERSNWSDLSRRPMKLVSILSLAALTTARPVFSDPDPAREVAVIAGAAATAALFNFLPIRDQRPLREHEWLRLDDRVRDNYSSGASIASDGSLALAIAVPAALAIGASADEAARDR